VVGEVSLVDGSPASATVVTTEPSVLYYLTVEQFMNLRRNRDVLAGHLLSVAAAASASRVYDCYRLVGRDLVGSTGTPVTALGNPETGRQAIAIKDPAELLGSTLGKDSIAHLESIGTYRDLESDEALYVTGQNTDHIALVVGGALAVISPDNGQILDVLTPGKWAGVIDYFGGAVTRGDVVSTEASRVLMFDRVRVEDLVSGGDESGFQLLELLAGAVVATLRRANIAAQEARARHDSELESELQQRAQDLAASRGQVLQPLQHQNQTTLPAVPFVGAHDVDSTLAACLTAVLLAHGHSDVTESRVRPQIGDDDAQLEAVGEILRRYGLLLRPLATSPNDLRYLEHPLFVLLGTSTFVVGQQWRRKGLEVMDPVMGHRTLSQQCLQTEFHGSAFEIRPQVSRELGYQSLWSRVKEYFGKHRKGLVGMSGATVLFEVCRLSIPLATVLAIDFILPFEDWSLFVITALGLSGALLIALLLEGFRLNSLRYLRAKLGLSLLEQLVSRILRLPILTLQQMRPAVLMQRFRSLDQLRKQFDNRCIYGLLDAITLAVSVAVLAFLNPVVALVVGITSLSLLTFLALNQPRLHRLAESTQREELQNSERLSELLESIQTTRSCGDPDNGFNRWCPGFRRFIRAEGRQHRAVATLESITDAVQVGLIGVVLCLGAMAVVLGTLSLGVLIAVVLVTLTAASGLNGVTQSMMTLSLARPQVTKLNKVLELQTESDEHKQSVQILRGGIELDAVDFRYLDDAPRVLTDISFKVEPGSKIAIVGASGSGKSTLGKLLMGLYMPNSGRTLIDGYDISALDLPGLRRQIGAVLQSTQLMSGTIRSNIAGNRPDCDLQTVMEAADIAAIHDLIETLPMKYDTVLAEGGGGLSVGQRQRISIARALVHQPKLLLLDEATSALDNQSQQRVESRLRRLGLTRIVIAHRLSTVLDADQILVLDQGRIKERGRHEELMARKDLYYHLIQSQAA